MTFQYLIAQYRYRVFMFILLRKETYGEDLYLSGELALNYIRVKPPSLCRLCPLTLETLQYIRMQYSDRFGIDAKV